MTEIADFLRARIAERRALAEAAAAKAESGDWRYKPGADYVAAVQTFPDETPARREHWIPLVTEAGSYVGDMLDDEIGQHIAANDPAAAIADCDAKLRMLNDAEDFCQEYDNDLTELDDNSAAQRAYCWRDSIHRNLAAAFIGHPDHKGEEWAS
ncbi:DUF6221 family protein [Streptomyces sp. NPDC058202]|uniref:DUF6221 family protein n=1 Tax=Streptomyces sp. NPDC058202 TaxID=3346380 RepID=UPI0036F12AC5